MYSVLLMAAMTAAPETPNCWFHCAPVSTCHGCYGGSYYNGCYGSCRGYSSCYGCYGGGGGYMTPYSCGGYGIYGGASYTWPTTYPYGGNPGYGYGYPQMAPPVIKIEEKKVIPMKTYVPTAPNQAQVVIRLPADAKLFANGQLTSLTSAERAFSTPTIEKDRDFQYTMKVEYIRDGKNFTDSQIVKVRAGEVSIVEFVDLSKATTVTSTINVEMPEGAKVFVENKPLVLPEGQKSFKTPALTKGAEYAYEFRAELTRDGKSQSQTQRVVFKGGEPVTVDFKDMNAIRTVSR